MGIGVLPVAGNGGVGEAKGLAELLSAVGGDPPFARPKNQILRQAVGRPAERQRGAPRLSKAMLSASATLAAMSVWILIASPGARS